MSLSLSGQCSDSIIMIIVSFYLSNWQSDSLSVFYFSVCLLVCHFSSPMQTDLSESVHMKIKPASSETLVGTTISMMNGEQVRFFPQTLVTRFSTTHNSQGSGTPSTPLSNFISLSSQLCLVTKLYRVRRKWVKLTIYSHIFWLPVATTLNYSTIP